MAIGLGTAAIGRPQYINIRDKKNSALDLNAFKLKGLKILDKAYQLGIRYFDTAPGYGFAEQLVLEWLQSKDDKTIQVATKWGYTYVANFNSNAKIHEVKEHSLKKLNEQWEFSKKFNSHLKVYQIHSATLETGVLKNQAILERLAFLKEEYQIEIGITTTGYNQVELIKEALDVTIDNNQLFDAFQVTYNILDQSLFTVVNELEKQNKKIIVKEALANGRLFRNEKYTHYLELYENIETLAQKYNVGVDAIALSFCKQTIPKSIILSGASRVEHLESNYRMNEFRLTPEDVLKLKGFNLKTKNYWKEREQLSWN